MYDKFRLKNREPLLPLKGLQLRKNAASSLVWKNIINLYCCWKGGAALQPFEGSSSFADAKTEPTAAVFKQTDKCYHDRLINNNYMK